MTKDAMCTMDGTIDWERMPLRPVALVLLPRDGDGTVVAYREDDGSLYGCRDVRAGPTHDDIVGAWIDSAAAAGYRLEDYRTPS